MIITRYQCDVCEKDSVSVKAVEIKKGEDIKSFDFCDRCLAELNTAIELKNDIEVLGKEANLELVNLYLRRNNGSQRISF